MDQFEFIFHLSIVALVILSPVILFFFGWFVGSHVERRHYRSIHQREQALLRLPAIPTRTLESGRTVVESRLVMGAVVISNDPFKKFLARLRMIFGGRLRSYESLLDRARREAVLRMKESFPEADAILNLRLETSAITRKHRDKGMGAVEVVASGTAIRYQPVA
jgi:uncharacterized protein YbjQ (UPF0145 family)